MAGNSGGGSGNIWSAAGELAKSFGLGGTIALVGFALIGLAIYKAPEFPERPIQVIDLAGGLVIGCLAILLGWLLIRRASQPSSNGTRRHDEYDIFLAVPMAGFGVDEVGRKVAVDVVRSVDAALKRLPGVKNIHAPALVRPEVTNYETPSTAFDIELQALKGAKRYLLLLPPVIPATTSVLVTAGIAIGLNIPSVILAHETLELPYLLEGAVQSKQANIRLFRFSDIDRLN